MEVIQNKDHLSVIADSVRQKEMEKDAINSLQDAIADKEEAIVDIKSNPKVKKLNEIIERNMNASVGLLRKWMNEDK